MNKKLMEKLGLKEADMKTTVTAEERISAIEDVLLEMLMEEDEE